jgi:hypothetical protein
MEASIKKLRMDIDIKYLYKNIEDVLLLYWLFTIIFEKSPKVSIYKFKKRLAVISFIDIGHVHLNKLNYFLYNIVYIKNKKKSLKSYSTKNVYLSYKENRINTLAGASPTLCQFKAAFKREPLDYIFSDLGVSGYRLFFTIFLMPLSKDLLLKRNLLFDTVSMDTIDSRIKSYFS